MAYEFDHERLDVYRIARDVARWLQRQKFPRGTAHLKDQILRATQSTVLNIAEGAGRYGNAGRNHYRIALGSAAAVLFLTAVAASWIPAYRAGRTDPLETLKAE